MKWESEDWHSAAAMHTWHVIGKESPSISDPTAHKSVFIHEIPSWGLKNEKNGENLFQIQKKALGRISSYYCHVGAVFIHIHCRERSSR